MAAAASEDFNIYKSLWNNINDVCAPPPPPGGHAVACFLMELPGFSVDPNAFDPNKFAGKESTMPSPDYATALLCDRVPAIAQYFYDTGNHISFYWQMLLSMYGITTPPEDNTKLKARYDEAIKMLYGSPEGYVTQQKTKLFNNLDVLRSAWNDKETQLTDYRTQCQKNKDKWPGNYEIGAGPKRDAVQQAFTEYNNLKMEIKHYEAAIFAYASGDLNTLMLDQETKFAMQQMTDPGNTDASFYQISLQPANWYEWFQTPASKSDKPEEGWTEVTIDKEHQYESSHKTFDRISTGIAASYGGLYYHGSAGGGFSHGSSNSSLTKKESSLKIKFKVRKVIIQRPWMEPVVLQYSTLGIKQVEIGKWSSGVMDQTNKGSFPLLPTAFVVAKDVSISGDCIADKFASSSSTDSENAHIKIGIGPFSISGNFSHAHGSATSTHKYDKTTKTVTIDGAQIIGWVCTSIPKFPQAEVKTTATAPPNPNQKSKL